MNMQIRLHIILNIINKSYKVYQYLHSHKWTKSTSIEVQKVINKHNSTISKFLKNNKYSQHECKPPYNIIQTTSLLLHVVEAVLVATF